MDMLFVGDVMLGRLVNEYLKTAPAAAPWGDTLPLFRSVDVRIANLECVIADSGKQWKPQEKRFHFRTDAKNVRTLLAAGINCVSLANNHTLDYGYGAMREMLAILDEAGIHRAGAGSSLDEAAKPAIFQIAGMRIGCISFTDNQPDWAAGEKQAGVYYMPTDMNDARTRDLLEQIERTRPLVDVLIVCAHWGPNWGRRPRPAHVQLAHALVDHGADIIFGHSCHVFQGIEFYRDRPILYSCGDFVDDYRIDPQQRNDQSFVFVVEVQDHQPVRLRLYPIVIERFQARHACNSDTYAIVELMQSLCAEFGTVATWHEEARVLRVTGGEGSIQSS